MNKQENKHNEIMIRRNKILYTTKYPILELRTFGFNAHSMHKHNKPNVRAHTAYKMLSPRPISQAPLRSHAPAKRALTLETSSFRLVNPELEKILMSCWDGLPTGSPSHPQKATLPVWSPSHPIAFSHMSLCRIWQWVKNGYQNLWSPRVFFSTQSRLMKFYSVDCQVISVHLRSAPLVY